ncbi:nucleic acid-binding protein [Haloarcula sp. CBA1130]|uniref:Zn-ribbon domain-containing OB-fold protein n=1 Tax=unclassified Haloarcula TaxID=2624677 RepID=UPI001248E260|nr:MULTISPECIES: OB-fold domain-containing protein [unclassified Haloarcula]KAA9397784.1 nucleic acid-binding protein [Haloarcula sp. CBA1129]KAA9402529.1 nucleic acid-binding protein [Haloarcula sp. CBA1130]
MTESAQDGEYDAWLDSIESDEGYFLECSNGHGWLPPRRVCPRCHDQDLSQIDLPESGEIASHTTITVPTPQFEDDAPYVTAIVDFGPVSVTGLVRDVDPDDVAIGDVVGIDVGERVTTGERAVVFRPR